MSTTPKEYSGSTTCPICSATVMIKASRLKKGISRKLALADHVMALHVKRDALGHVTRFPELANGVTVRPNGTSFDPYTKQERG